jgi:hypothetical protein
MGMAESKSVKKDDLKTPERQDYDGDLTTYG